MRTDPASPRDWFLMASDRLEKADVIFERFWEQHYPGGELDEVGEGYSEIRASLGTMFLKIADR